MLKGVDAEHGSLRISLKKEHITIPNLPVISDPEIVIDGHHARLIDLQTRIGRQIQLRMDADPERSRVVGVYCKSTGNGK